VAIRPSAHYVCIGFHRYCYTIHRIAYNPVATHVHQRRLVIAWHCQIWPNHLIVKVCSKNLKRGYSTELSTACG